jgi:hypothetical protein
MPSDILLPAIWNHLNDERFGFMNVLSESIRTVELRHPHLLPNLRDAETLVIGSDYGGHHAASRFESFSFVIADHKSCLEWANRRRRLREAHLNDGRRLAYKNLNDGKRRAILDPFLRIADELPGLLFSVLVDKDVASLFGDGIAFRRDDPSLVEFDGWSPSVIEKFLRIIHLVSFLLAGLSAPAQHVMWVTDQDDIVANTARLNRCVELLARICSHYLPHSLGHLRVATTKSDTGSRDLEDFVAIPDLASGALCDVVSELKLSGGLPASEIIQLLGPNLQPKAKAITAWLSEDGHPLRRLIYAIDEMPTVKRLRATCLRLESW